MKDTIDSQKLALQSLTNISEEIKSITQDCSLEKTVRTHGPLSGIITGKELVMAVENPTGNGLIIQFVYDTSCSKNESMEKDRSAKSGE